MSRSEKRKGGTTARKTDNKVKHVPELSKQPDTIATKPDWNQGGSMKSIPKTYADNIIEIINRIKNTESSLAADKAFEQLVVEATINREQLKEWILTDPKQYIGLLGMCVERGSAPAMNVCRGICDWMITEETIVVNKETGKFRINHLHDTQKHAVTFNREIEMPGVKSVDQKSIIEGWRQFYYVLAKTSEVETVNPNVYWTKFFETQELFWLIILRGLQNANIEMCQYNDRKECCENLVQYFNKLHGSVEIVEKDVEISNSLSPLVVALVKCVLTETDKERLQGAGQFVASILPSKNECALINYSGVLTIFLDALESENGNFGNLLASVLALVQQYVNDSTVLHTIFETNGPRLLKIYIKSLPDDCGNLPMICECPHDNLLRAIRGILIDHIATIYPLILQYQFCDLLELYKRHAVDGGIDALIGLLPYAEDEPADHLDFIFYILVNQKYSSNNYVDLLVMLAQICYGQFQHEHVLVIEKLIIDSPNNTMQLLQVLLVLSENNPGIMKYRGNNYYGFVRRDAMQCLHVINAVLRNVACVSKNEAERVLSVMKSHHKEMQNNMFTNNMLLHWREIALAQPKCMRPYLGFLMDLTENKPTVKPNAIRVLEAMGAQSTSCSIQ